MIDLGDNAVTVILALFTLISSIATAVIAVWAGTKASSAERVSMITDVKTDALRQSVDGIVTQRVDAAEKLGHAEGHASGLKEGNGGTNGPSQVEVVNPEPIPVKVDPPD